MGFYYFLKGWKRGHLLKKMNLKTHVPKMNLRIIRAKYEKHPVYLNMSKWTTNLLVMPLENRKSGPHIFELMLDWEAWVKDAMV